MCVSKGRNCEKGECMKVLYIVVDELPDSCLVCRLTEWRDEVKRALAIVTGKQIGRAHV